MSPVLTTNTTETHFIFLDTAPSLQKISAFNVALELWRDKCPTGYESNITSAHLKALFNDEYNDIISSIYDQPLPTSIRKMLGKYVNLIKTKIDRWIDSNNYRNYKLTPVFFTPFIFFSHLNDVIWNVVDFTIDEEKTAKNMLKNGADQFDKNQQFVVACIYCFRDLIDESTRQKLANLSIMNANGAGIRENMVQYWIYLNRCTDEFVNDVRIISMIKSSSSFNRSASCYFWNRLNSDWLVQLILYFIKRKQRLPFEYVLGNLSRSQWVELVNENGAGLMIHMMMYCTRYDYIIQLWIHVESLFDGDRFMEILKWNLAGRKCCDSQDDCVHKDLWISSSDRLKSSVLDAFLNNRHLLESKAFLQVVLQSAGDRQKIEFLRNNTSYLISSYSPKYLSKLIYSCFERNQIILFKQTFLLNFSAVSLKCHDLFANGNFEEFDFLLKWLSVDESETMELKRKILRVSLSESSNETELVPDFNHLLTYKHLKEYKQLDKFIDGAFPSNHLVSDYKYELVLALSNLQLLPNIFKDANKLPLIMNFTNFFISSEHQLVQIKRNFAHNFKKFIEKGCFYPQQCHLQVVDGFLTWCLGNEQINVLTFKRSLDVQKIRDLMLQKCQRPANSILSHDRNYFERVYSSQQLEWFMEWNTNSISADSPVRNKIAL